jgi:hypothetical protein
MFGSIDDVRIYKKVLSAAEVAGLRDSPDSSLDTVPPSTPTITGITSSSASIELSWTASTDNNAVTAYHLEHCQGSSCTSFAHIASPTGTRFTDVGLASNTAYRYRLRATDAAGNLSSYSNIASATTPDYSGFPLTIESFESGNNNNYVGQVDECYQITTSDVIGGHFSGVGTGVGWGDTALDPLAYCTMVSTAGLVDYPRVGDTFEVKIRVDTVNTYGSFLWGVQHNSYPWPAYRLRIDTGATAEVELEKITYSGPIEQHFITPENTLSHIPLEGDLRPRTNVVYTATITWNADGTMPYVIRDPHGVILARDSSPKPDTEYTFGGIGFMTTSSNRDQTFNHVTYDDIRILSRSSAASAK